MSTYVVSDIHGVYPIFEQIKKFLKSEDKCYVLGDCADRGSEGWKIIQEVIRDDRFIYIKGNHEQLLIDAADQYNRYGDYYSNDYYLLCSNGGEQTFLDWTYTSYRNEWIYKLKELPTQAKYINANGKEILLSHAGYTPGKHKYECDEDLIWDRKHFTDKWDEEKYPNSIIVHGHTPTLYVDADLNNTYDRQMKPGAYWYCNNHKVCIDNGTFATGYAVLLDLDTFEEHIFECENFIA